MLLSQHRLDRCSAYVREFLERRAAEERDLSSYEWELLRALQKGMKFIHADLFVRRATLSRSEQELSMLLSANISALQTMLSRLAEIERLEDPYQKLVLAALDLGFKDPYLIYRYTRFYRKPLLASAS